ncbi:SDR family NAD(P)-dependent oxidoreductase, partial [Alphaproteobacteria bacterium]|nr:SDR family NAD(P)-dependent oxidoreductase [Alphaproteobacteria bacterium]
MRKYNFKGKKILITGGANGLGYHVCLELTKRGAHVIVIDKDNENLLKLENKCKPNIETYCYNLKDLKKLNILLEEIDKKHNVIDCVINNAAYELAGFIDELEINDIIDQYNANFFSGIMIIKKFIKKLSISKGKIVSLSSDAGFRGVPTRSIYCSSKSAIYYFAESLRLEYQKYDVASVTVLPPKLDSTFWEHIEYRGSIKEKP